MSPESGTAGQVQQVVLPRRLADARTAAHRRKVCTLAEDFLKRRSRGEKHPVWDFLFTYYDFPPAKLISWVPGIAEPVEAETPLSEGEETMAWDVPPMTPRIRDQARWITSLCEKMLDRPARFGCFGLHEWAMVYGQSSEQLRHQGWRLRLSPAALSRFLDNQSLSCTHYDAYRFFTTTPRDRNQFELRIEKRTEMEQCGCLHANMDLYKWSYKLWPWIGSDLVADTFLVAVEGRKLDMRASPYDLAEAGFPPILVEKPAGRDEYQQEQRKISDAAEPLRQRLLAAARRLAGL